MLNAFFWYYFLHNKGNEILNAMPQARRSRENEGNERSRDTAAESHYQECNGFEGMNYEQFREPYKNNRDRNNAEDERNDRERPDES